MPNIRCGSCGGLHSSVADVKSCHSGERPEKVAQVDPITQPQLRYINTLLGVRPAYQDVMNLWPEHIAELTKQQASKLIEELKEVPPESGAHPIRSRPIEDGMYRHPESGAILRVYHTVHGANQQVAKELVVFGPDEDGTYTHEFKYLGKNGLRGLGPDDLLPEEEAKRLGMMYGFCVRCGRELTRNESQYVGYGQTCAGHEGWWYPSAAELRALMASAEDPSQPDREPSEAGS